MRDRETPFSDLIANIHEVKEFHTPLPLIDRIGADPLEGNFHFTTSVGTLLLLSRMIERTLTVSKRKCTLYSGFQYLSVFKEHIERYKGLSDHARRMFIIGVPDVEIESWADNVHIVTRGSEIVGRNWLSIVDGQRIKMSLIAEEVTQTNQGNTARERKKYRGFFTDSKFITQKAVETLVETGILGQKMLF